MSFSNEKLLKTLELDVGRTKEPTNDSTSTHWAVYLLQRNLCKKFVGDTDTTAAENGIAKFIQINNQMKLYRYPDVSDRSKLSSRIIERASALWHEQFLDSEGFPRFGLGHAYNRGMVGPGASTGATGHDMLSKLFMSKLSGTSPTLLKMYRAATRENFRWEIADLVRQSQFGGFSEVKGSTLFTVPKEATIKRVAFTEPTLNMWGQLGYGECLKDILQKHHSIDLSTQPRINSWFARAGSLNGTFATVDLVSASDTISCNFIKNHLPKRLVSDLNFIRSPRARVPGRKGWTDLNMISTMGNGFTFPLQTLIFANLVLAMYIEMKENIFDVYGKRRYGVFGDDIICVSKLYPVLLEVLTACGFQVNDKKSFSTGNFRESCGTDFFKGTNVRAVYFKECKSDAHIYSLINRLLIWSARHNVGLPNVFRYLLGLVQYRPVPYSETLTAGIYTPIRFLRARKSEFGHWTYHPLRPIVNKQVLDLSVGDMYFHGSVISAIFGSIKAHTRSLRNIEATEYKVVKEYCPTSWEYIVQKPLLQRSLYEFDAVLTKRAMYDSYLRNIGYVLG